MDIVSENKNKKHGTIVVILYFLFFYIIALFLILKQENIKTIPEDQTTLIYTGDCVADNTQLKKGEYIVRVIKNKTKKVEK